MHEFDHFSMLDFSEVESTQPGYRASLEITWALLNPPGFAVRVGHVP